MSDTYKTITNCQCLTNLVRLCALLTCTCFYGVAASSVQEKAFSLCMHTDLHLVIAQYHTHQYLLQPMSATAAVTGEATIAVTVLTEVKAGSQ